MQNHSNCYFIVNICTSSKNYVHFSVCCCNIFSRFIIIIVVVVVVVDVVIAFVLAIFKKTIN